MDTKEAKYILHEIENVSKSSVTHDAPSDVDAAWKYLDGHRDAHADTTALKALRRKIDFHIVPIMFCCYTMQFLDKVILNVSSWIPTSPQCGTSPILDVHDKTDGLTI